ncbi:sulfite exporter TauE/SafE family protein [Massilia sp. YIM B02763]|uniref:sulfite exporter TauE/SafE family protein n=1 Tax=Massilia sp. YIM B02763 TaxID=3050130 RepID=UPI0025B64D8F|nr:sulfite exporter TauE/SafE family protein [Massilia sp. YIM B02763]MDN4055054.1 sulfite exporter TauE/SafE family protein [Massilia sp. YIM B02763]
MNTILSAEGLGTLAYIFLVFLLAGTVKGVVGLGLPTVAVGLLGIVMAPREAAALLIIPSLVTNAWQLAAGPGLADLLRRLWPMLAAIVAGTLAGGALLPPGGAAGAGAALGGALMLYAASGLAAFRLDVAPHAERHAGPLVGLATGLITAATGVFVIPAVPYLGGLRLERDALVQALGLAFTASTCALAAALLLAGQWRLHAAGLSLYALAPALLGMWLGQHLRGRIRPALFRRCFFAGLLALGLHLMLAPFIR